MKKRFNQIKVIINKKIKAIDNAYIVCNNIPSLTVNKHQSTGKPLNKGISVLLFNLECCMELSFQ